ncbi:hypothetical protein AC578_10086 [Pseudocercospora eumusae]|uniref:Peroxin 11C n=1 Tax=Pseudocercospora eumusae TaxID=321146 RepID=A0A139GX16_9PEZI|nr:hypothetical protein AC578_10086 [Pseudocercospora eumusae]
MPDVKQIRQLILSSLFRSSVQTDAFLSHLYRLLSTTGGIEAALCTLYYTLAFTHAQLTRLLAKKYERLAESIATRASKTMLPGETLVATIEPPHLTLTETCAAVKSLGDVIEDFRMFTRLWNLLNIYQWAKDTRTKQPRDPALKLLAWAKIGASAGFQIFENVAYLTRRGVLRGERWRNREARYWVYSSRFWLAEVAIEGLRLLRVRQLQYNEDFGAESYVDVGEKEMKMQSKELENKWWHDLYANLGWLPSSVHFSFFDEDTSPITESAIGLGGMVPGIVALRQVWKETA